MPMKRVVAYLLVGGVACIQPASAERLKMGIVPLESAANMIRKFTPLSAYLSAELGAEIELVVGKDYQETMDAIGANQVQIAFLTPTTYPKAQRQNPAAGIQAVARFLVSGKGTYNSCIVVSKDSPISSLAELAGKSFAFGSKDSTSSCLMPKSMLVEAGVSLDKIKENHLKGMDNIVLAVGMGNFDAGGVMSSVAEEGAANGDVKILATSRPIPEFPVSVNASVDSVVRAKLLAALMKLNEANPAHKTVLESINPKYTGVEPAGDGDYDVIRDMIGNIYGDAFYAR